MSFKLNQPVIVLVLFVVLVGACRPATEAPSVTSTPTPSVALTPTPNVGPTVLDSPLPTPTATLSAMDSPLPTPTRGPSAQGRAAVRGTLFLTDPQFTAPEEDGVYLVEVDTGAGMTLPAIDPKTSLQAEVDEATGAFFIDGVEDGLYALVALTRMGTQLSISKLETGEPVTVLVGEDDLGQVIDLGQLRLP